jgi:undecaprenyl diphosphate synthase
MQTPTTIPQPPVATTAISRVPAHVAIIMDGNGRWAQGRNRPRVFGHIRGASRIRAIVSTADRMGVRALTLFAFSTENWSRPEDELKVLWRLLAKYLRRELDHLDRENVRLRVIGELDRLPESVRSVLEPAVARLAGNTGLQLVFAVSYGGRRELVHAARRFAEQCASGNALPSDLTEARLAEGLWTADLGELSEVDLVIRTSGEQRISNFLLWQVAYSEFVFSERAWPDFSSEDFEAAVNEYARRERRFGGVTA